MMSSAKEVDPTVTLEFANTAVINSAKGNIKDEFKKVIEDNYSAEVCNKDFGKDDVMGYINNWCKNNTHGIIPELLSEKPSTIEFAHFLNAIYFKGIWSSQFKRGDSKSEEIRDINGNKHKVNMMHQEGHFNYAAVPGVGAALSLPFGNQAYSMLFIIPENGKITDLHKALSIEAWEKVTSMLHDENVDVKIPSFESSFNVDLVNSLRQLGIVDAFDPVVAHFDLMCDKDIYIDKVLHKASICVDEQGSEAAAITDVVMAYCYMGPNGIDDSLIEFHANQPFIYAITEVSTGAIFIIGQYTGKKAIQRDSHTAMKALQQS